MAIDAVPEARSDPNGPPLLHNTGSQSPPQREGITSSKVTGLHVHLLAINLKNRSPPLTRGRNVFSVGNNFLWCQFLPRSSRFKHLQSMTVQREGTMAPTCINNWFAARWLPAITHGLT
jgi:hypothetical protein